MIKRVAWLISVLVVLGFSGFSYYFYRSRFYRRQKPDYILQMPSRENIFPIPVSQRPPGYEDFTHTAASPGPPFYQGKSVQRAEGNFIEMIKDNFLKLSTDQGQRLFWIKKTTKAACQPTGNIDVAGKTVPANNVFIDDQGQQDDLGVPYNLGIPWGIEIDIRHIQARVISRSETQVYYQNEVGTFTDLPNVMYVWFKTCHER